ncbi:conserved hypothetical protein [Leishmania braziliensis MHOM/BR/75/M2904]|uniref:Histone-binding protein RBBP4-like N-terminal domain-containing protein n=2 Tax=Leishmania braziliensis TaxID=5660 RepID=A4HI50_LEIBR|nr:conserved hypothetical protein [Leishmania braziliensis MHOM/BR/75/M2904]CAJ2477071.1 unnamed protein product [Leishmania braziliensis]CAM40256.1 conserved hypothetical protein [Leishmania braziliensis MHOM/BR/75/M2904]SYZ67916.1 Histone-binding_protein_RBBP4_or_subunit_C_of_CAF1_complex/WD_domain [Leishmania braziliensis MHOM/BR/75/M2904]
MNHSNESANSAGVASSFPQPPPTQSYRGVPPLVAPPASRVTRSQALTRLQRGKESSTEIKSVSTRGNDANELKMSEMRKGCVIGGTDADTQQRKQSEKTSSHAAVPPTVNSYFDARMTALRDQRRRNATVTPDDRDDAGAAFPETDNASWRRRRCRGHGAEGANSDAVRDGASSGSADDVCDADSIDDGSESNWPTHRGVADGATTVAPSANSTHTHIRRRFISTHQAANALPRMLALQRSFEAEAKYLYEYCGTHVVEWPTLAVEWIPDRAFVDPERDYTLQYLAIGTQVHPLSGTVNTVKVMEVAVPVNTTKDVMYGLYGDDDIAGVEAVYPEQEGHIDPGKRFANVKGHFHCEQELMMDAAVLKIRAMPAETNIIAVKTATGFIGVYNLVQDFTENEAGRTVPDAMLRGHRRGGFGLSWNTLKPGFIASAADDHYVNYYDVSHRLTIDMREASAVDPALTDPEIQPLERLVGHRDIVSDCCWHSSQGHLLASSSMDGDARLWDIRMNTSSSTIHSAHASGATAAQFHPIGAFQLATAGAEGGIRLWDIRRTTDPIWELNYHGCSITGLQWSPFSETVLLSYGADGRVVLWDLAKASLPLDYSEDQLAPPEVSFVHIGHVGRVTDASWNPSKTEEWLLASADTTNGVQVYRPLRSVVLGHCPYQQ